MGWLELLPLLRRTLPLLSRVAPMLESFVGARGTISAGTSNLEEHFSNGQALSVRNHAEIKRTLQDHTDHLMVLTDDVKQLRIADEQYGHRLAVIEDQVSNLSRNITAAAYLTLLLVIGCFVLLLLIYRRH